MTVNTLTIELTCNGKTLKMGPGQDIDITAVSGLEASEVEISTSDNALVDGASVDGKKIKPRPIHIEASFRSSKNNPENRAKVIKFFNPKYTGKALITNMGVSRNIEYELEGWTFAASKNMDSKLKILVDLICPDPYMLNVDNFGKNMANITPLFSFPWISLRKRMETGKLDYKPEARGLLLGGNTAGYRTLKKEVVLSNDGDVPGQFMRVSVTMQTGDVLLIDTNDRHQVITLNGVNYYQRIDRRSEPFKLEVGDNYLEYDADGNYTNLDVNLFYTPKYLGV